MYQIERLPFGSLFFIYAIRGRVLVLRNDVFGGMVSCQHGFCRFVPYHIKEYAGVRFNMPCKCESQRRDCSLRFLFYAMAEKQDFFLFTLRVKIYILIMENLHIFLVL